MGGIGETFIPPFIMLVIGGCITYFINIKLEEYKVRQQEVATDYYKEKAVKQKHDKYIDDSVELLRTGMRAIHRDIILQRCYEYIQRGHVHRLELENLSKMYNAYHALGGNDIATASYNKVLSLPVHE